MLFAANSMGASKAALLLMDHANLTFMLFATNSMGAGHAASLLTDHIG